MTFDQFSPIFATLAMQLRAKDADEALARSYHLALRDLEPEFVAIAAVKMAQHGGADARKADQSPHWFPKTSEWRVEAAKVEADRTAELKARLRKLREPLCLECDDTGFARDVSNRVKPCTCRSLRRLEVLGRRPMPQLPSGDAA